VRLVVEPGPSHMHGRRVVDETFLPGVAVEPGDRAQPPGHRGAGATAGFEIAREAFDVDPVRLEQPEVVRCAPVAELAEVRGVGLACGPLVGGQEPQQRHPLTMAEDVIDRHQLGRGHGRHLGPPLVLAEARTPELGAPAVVNRSDGTNAVHTAEIAGLARPLRARRPRAKPRHKAICARWCCRSSVGPSVSSAAGAQREWRRGPIDEAMRWWVLFGGVGCAASILRRAHTTSAILSPVEPSPRRVPPSTEH
jgi:hypothetical protein